MATAKFLKVMALSKKPSDFRPAADIPLPLAGSSSADPKREPLHDAPMGQLPIGHSPSGVIPYGDSLDLDKVHFEWPVDVPGIGRRQPYRCLTVQDGETPAETRLFAELMKLCRYRGKPYDEASSLIQVSLTDLKRMLRTDHKQIMKLLRSLQEKQSIEVFQCPDMKAAQAAVYRVYSFTQILKRREQSGLIWAVKNRGVQFIPLSIIRTLARAPAVPQDHSPMGHSPPGDLPMGSLLVDIERPMGHSPQRPMGYSPERPMGHSPPSPYKELSVKNTDKETSAAAAVETVSRTVRKYLTIDDHAIRQLLQNCQNVNPEATVEEIAKFAEVVILQNQRNPKVKNFSGLLITATPKFLEPGSRELERYRQERKEQSHQTEDSREALEAVLADPNAPEEDKALARDYLAK
jgi:hypothetical protein